MNPYPTINPNSDTGALSDIPAQVVSKIERQPIAAGAIIGGVLGHFLFGKKALIGAGVGAAIGTLFRTGG